MEYVSRKECHERFDKLHGSLKLVQGELAVVLMILVPLAFMVVRFMMEVIRLQALHAIALFN